MFLPKLASITFLLRQKLFGMGWDHNSQLIWPLCSSCTARSFPLRTGRDCSDLGAPKMRKTEEPLTTMGQKCQGSVPFFLSFAIRERRRKQSPFLLRGISFLLLRAENKTCFSSLSSFYACRHMSALYTYIPHPGPETD